MATYLSTHTLSLPYWAVGHGLSCQAKFHPKQFLNTHPINPPKRELVMEMLTETWRDSRATISVYYTLASLAADPSLPSPSFSISVLWLINAQNLWNILTVEGNIWPPAQINTEKLQHPQPDIVTVPDGANVQLQVVMRKPKEEEHMQKLDHWKREKQQTCLTAFVFLYDIHDLSSLEADLRVLLLLIVGHHHILLQDHGFRASISTWGREKASRKPASSHGSLRVTSVHPIHDRPTCHQSQANQQTTLARSISPNGWPYRNSLLWPTTQQHRGTSERRKRKKGGKKYEKKLKTVN